jgi:uncharacterized protein
LNLDHSKDQVVGRSIITQQYQSTMDLFWFVVEEGVIVNPFDFVSVDNINNSISVGIVKDMRSVVIKENLFLPDVLKYIPKDSNIIEAGSSQHVGKAVERNHSISIGKPKNILTIAKVAIIANTGDESLTDIGIGDDIARSINMPIKMGKIVKFATLDQISFALGIPEMKHPIPAGVIEMSNGLQIPISLDITYIAGPDTAHVNVSGISGNQKTTYLLFLLQSSYQTLLKKQKEKVAIIIFNLKQDDLLHIDKKPHDDAITKRQRNMFNIMNLELEPFENVTYFLPRGSNGKPNSALESDSINHKNIKTYSYELLDIYDRLDLLFPDLHDPRYNLLSIVDFIHETWPTFGGTKRERNKRKMKPKQKSITWTDLLKYDKFPSNVIQNKTSLLHFRSQIQKLKNSSIFVDRKRTSTYLGNEILNIKSGDVFVIDIGMISSIPEQSFIVGDVMKTVDQIFSSSDFSYSQEREQVVPREKKNRPHYLFVFIDEINRFAPSSYASLQELRNSSLDYIIKTTISGGSRGIVLFSAQQFKSTTDLRLHDNAGLHVTAKLGLSELSKLPYSNLIDDNTKSSTTRLNRGEMVMIHPALRHPIKLLFPHAAIEKP